jgi:transposase-like protein
MAGMLVKCPTCQSVLIDHHGKARSDLQRYRCRDCHHCFQLDYLYAANKPSVTDKITKMALNGSGVRDTGRVLVINHNNAGYGMPGHLISNEYLPML